MKKLLLTGALLLMAVPAHATISIGALTQLCGYNGDGKELAPSAHASCQSYIAGIVDYHELFKTVGKTSANIDFCLPPTLTYTDIQRVVLEYLQSHSTFKDSPASSAVVLSLHNEYPCGGDMSGFTTSESGTVPANNATGDVQTGVSADANGDLAPPDMDDMSGQ